MDELAEYGVGIIDTDDISEYVELHGISFEEFSKIQLETILDGVRAVDGFLNSDVATYFQSAINPGGAFKSVFGNIKFGYVPSRTSGQTIATGTDDEAPMNLENPIFILLEDQSFPTASSIKPPFKPAFVVVHELGHAFSNRHGGKTDNGLAPIAALNFVEATGSCWVTEVTVVAESTRCGIDLPEYKNSEGENLDIHGNVTTDPSQYAYIILAGFYVALGYAPLEPPYFPNELRPDGSNPSEGFADTFSNFILNRDVMPEGESLRRSYFEDNIGAWITTVISRNPPPS